MRGNGRVVVEDYVHEKTFVALNETAVENGFVKFEHTLIESDESK